MAKKALYIGILSGTSMDAIDATLVDFSKKAPVVVMAHSLNFPSSLRETIKNMTDNRHCDIRTLGKADTALGQLFANCCTALIKKSGVDRSQIIAIGSHGQTIFHEPNSELPFTIQLGNPNIIAVNTGVQTIADFRRKDIALGGQGAPLAPAFHTSLFENQYEDQWVLNLGGIANLTFIPGDKKQPTIGFDTGPANTLIDYWFHKHHQEKYDNNGHWAASGKTNAALLARFLEETYFHQPAPKSTGTEYFNTHWLERHLRKEKPEDVQATLCELTAKTIADAIPNKQGNLWVCGGGINNQFLLSKIKHHCEDMQIQSTQALGIHPQHMECILFAWLAKQTVNNQPGNLPSVTGAKRPAFLGSITPVYIPEH